MSVTRVDRSISPSGAGRCPRSISRTHSASRLLGTVRKIRSACGSGSEDLEGVGVGVGVGAGEVADYGAESTEADGDDVDTVFSTSASVAKESPEHRRHTGLIQRTRALLPMEGEGDELLLPPQPPSPAASDASCASSASSASTSSASAAAAKFKKMMAIGMRPTLIVGAVVTLVFGLASLFLETYVVTANAAVVVFVVGSYVVWSSYHTFHFYLSEYSSSYAAVPTGKQFYVLSNLIKSAALLSYTPLCAHLLYTTMLLDEWPSNRIRIMGTLYCIPDFVSLFMVKRMARTTQIHHLVVCAFNAVSLYNDYEQNNVVRAIMVYAVWSTFAYLVNLLLASRFVQTSALTSQVLSALALLIYAMCCSLNWSWQVWFLGNLVWTAPFQVTGYVCLMAMLVWDDVVLMKWLWLNMQRKRLEISSGSGSKRAE